ncbi:hypothetical protein E4U30_000996 [Claviceps sp. LM220 group G6]|nr:hypothetical protein E4U30_000996 [Claviceps sp. LM220 group G6]
MSILASVKRVANRRRDFSPIRKVVVNLSFYQAEVLSFDLSTVYVTYLPAFRAELNAKAWHSFPT